MVSCTVCGWNGRACARCDAARRGVGVWPQPYPNPLVPPGQVWFVDATSGKVVTKIVNIGAAMRPEEV